MPYLIINADDFGLTDGVDSGILQCLNEGVVTSTTIMACVPGAEERVRAQVNTLQDRAGVHLQLTNGKPFLSEEEVPSLVDASGRFPDNKRLVQSDPDDVVREWREQVRRVRSWGIEPTHLDTHHHIHKQPQALEAMVELAKELKLPVRAPKKKMVSLFQKAGIGCPDLCYTDWFGETATVFELERFLSMAFQQVGPDGVVELMVHPGTCDQELRDVSKYCEGRLTELNILTSSEVTRLIAESGMSLVNYNQIL